MSILTNFFYSSLDRSLATWIKLPFVLQWVVQGAIDVDIGANPSAEGGEDEGVDDQAVKVVDIVDTFRLQVNTAELYLFTLQLWLILGILFGLRSEY